MPRNELMTWEHGPRRWRKVVGPKIYTISCRKLGVPPTRIESYQAANAWWLAKKAELDGLRAPHPHADYIADMSKRRDIAGHPGEEPIRRALADEIAHVERGGLPTWMEDSGFSGVPPEGDFPEPPEWLSHAPPEDDSGWKDPEALERLRISMEIRDALDPFSPIWTDRVARDVTSPVPTDRTIGWHIERYLELERGRVAATTNPLSPSEYDLTRLCLRALGDWLGNETSPDKIDADRWESYWSHLLRWSGSIEYKKKRFRHARNFVAWLARKRVIPMPPNLDYRKYRFGGSARAVATMPTEEVRRWVESAPGQLKLHLLLMANCGMTQIDISELRGDEIDWTEGRIVRKRSKTREEASVPKVNYRLWPETWELLRRYGADRDRALLTVSGRHWVRDAVDSEGKRHKSDMIKTNFVHLAKRLGYPRTPPLKLIRKTSATLLDGHLTDGRFAGHFLGHAGQTIGEQHYFNREGRLQIFDEAVEWLGREYGFIS